MTASRRAADGEQAVAAVRRFTPDRSKVVRMRILVGEPLWTILLTGG